MPSKKATARGTLWKISVSIAPEAEEAAVEAMTGIFRQPASVYNDLEKLTTVVSVFVAKVDGRQRIALHETLARIRDAGLNIGLGRASIRRIPRENWAESWKRHFKPLEIGSKLLILPSWSKRNPKPGQAVVILDPGLSFGTGHHPTTGFCLEQISVWRDPQKSQSMLDVGTGSGILSIAAAKLGYAPVEALDFDPDAVRVAKENAAVNRVRFSISQKDLVKLPVRIRKRFDIVCANLIYDLLIQESHRIVNRVARDGMLVLAGILAEQFPAVRCAYEKAGMRLVGRRLAGEWCSGSFRFRP